MRVLVVDDEPLARDVLVKILNTRSDVEGVQTADDAVQALECLKNEPFDVILLDIEMPETSGLEMVDLLMKRSSPPPAIVFVTAYSQHAVAAFEKHAVDYVLKPFSEARIHEALNTAAHRNDTERAAKLVNALSQLDKTGRARKIAIKAKGKILFIDPNEVMSAKAEGNYVLLQQASGSHLVRESISTLADKLSPYGFIRIHRSALINAAYVEEIQPCLTGEYLLRLAGGEEFTVSRTFKKNLGAIADSWVGTDTFAAVAE
ncbi:MAG TPA: LytTR family DNA-binding domain-containing protein [Terriglobales bacterium]|nr:LytTR family DNA-binding domain-containing protein [Terriglobales bacterium]